PAATGRTRVVGARIENQIAFSGQAEQVLAEQAIEGLVETHDIERCLNGAIFDPESGKARHASNAASSAVRVVEIMYVVDVHASVESVQHLGGRQSAGCHI